mmetsp:Transcript_51250/g.121392  ORF Transcript_51250/g.121392 Transcript_51250/m.121392 type:complete len:239 (+) Transcript_51250:71-787(+)
MIMSIGSASSGRSPHPHSRLPWLEFPHIPSAMMSHVNVRAHTSLPSTRSHARLPSQRSILTKVVRTRRRVCCRGTMKRFAILDPCPSKPCPPMIPPNTPHSLTPSTPLHPCTTPSNRSLPRVAFPNASLANTVHPPTSPTRWLSRGASSSRMWTSRSASGCACSRIRVVTARFTLMSEAESESRKYTHCPGETRPPYFRRTTMWPSYGTTADDPPTGTTRPTWAVIVKLVSAIPNTPM